LENYIKFKNLYVITKRPKSTIILLKYSGVPLGLRRRLSRENTGRFLHKLILALLKKKSNFPNKNYKEYAIKMQIKSIEYEK